MLRFRLLCGVAAVVLTAAALPARAQQARPQQEPLQQGQDEASPSDRSPTPVQAAQQSSAAAETAQLQFNFSGTRWEDVLRWLADEADLSLQADRFPPGTLNFTDRDRTYSTSEALDLLNRLMLDKGYALVRRGRLLIVVDLEAELAQEYISSMAELVTPAELDSRGESDIVRCIFPLGAMTPEAAGTELRQMLSPSGSMTVLPSARQVVATDTVLRLKSIRRVLEDAEQAGGEVVEITLQHRAAEEILALARPLLDLEEGSNANETIRIAVDPFGDRLYAAGDPARISMLRRIVETADKPLLPQGDGEQAPVQLPELRTYQVAAADSSTALDVLQTLLAGLPDTRLTVDPVTGAVIAFARPETHQIIQSTLDKLQGKGTSFEIIQLRRLEPSAALLTINKFFGHTAENPAGPTVDGDPVTGRLWVRGTPEEIEVVKSLIERLEAADATGPLGDRVRILPYTGQTAADTLQQLEMLWEVAGRKNKIRMLSPSSAAGTSTGFPQRSVQQTGREERASEPAAKPESAAPAVRRSEPPEANATRLPERPVAANASVLQPDRALSERPRDDRGTLTAMQQPPSPAAAAEPSSEPQSAADAEAEASPARSGEAAAEGAIGSDIIVSMTPNGLIVASDDSAALTDFVDLMQTLASESGAAGAQPTVFWLKYIKASVASEIVTNVLGGGDSGGGLGGIADSMLGGFGGMMGGLLGMGGGGGDSGASGPILTSTGSVSIVADDRLNALFVQANAADMMTVEKILEVVDREESPEDVQTAGTPRLIPVIYQDATAVAEIVKGAFPEKIAQPGGSGGGGGNSSQRPSPQDFLEALRGGGGGSSRGGRSGGQAPKSEPPKVNVAVDTRSNSLIVISNQQDYEQIRMLVETIDQGGADIEESVQVVSIGGSVKPELVQQALATILGPQAQSSSTSSGSSSSSSSTPTSTSGSGSDGPSADDIRRRIEMFRAMQSSGGGSPFGGRSFGGRSGGDSGRGDSGRGDSGRGGSDRGNRGGR